VAIHLLRVDERLIHGQVTLGWGERIRPTRYVVVDDRLVRSDWERELYSLGIPPGTDSEFLDVEGARERLPAWKSSDERVVVVTRDLDHMFRLAAAGALRGTSVNLGGIHHAAGRRERLSYLFLDRADEERVRGLAAEGVEVVAQDLPSSARVPAARILDD